MSSLISLPNEVNSQILSHLPVPDLLNITLTSKLLRPLAEKHLYNTITLLWDAETISGNESQYFRKLHTLIVNVLRVPQRALCVQHLRVDFSGFFPLLSRPGTLTTRTISRHDALMSSDELSLFERAIEKVQYDKEEGERWRGDLIVGFTAAYIRLLLYQFRNLLEIDAGSLVGFPIYEFWRKGGLKEDGTREWEVYFGGLRRFGYTSVTEVDISRGDIWNYYVWENERDYLEPYAKVMFYSPAIRSLEVSLLPSKARLFGFWDFEGINTPPIATSLRELVIHKSFFGTKSLKTLFLSTPNLEVLHIHYPVSARVAATYGHHLIVPELIETFTPFRKELRELKITMAWRFEMENIRHVRDERPGILGNASSLKDLPALRRLDIPLVVLLGWESGMAPPFREVLPQNLWTLILRDDSEAWWSGYNWDFNTLSNFLMRGFEGGDLRRLERIGLMSRRGRYAGEGRRIIGDVRGLVEGRGLESGFVEYG